MSQQEKHRATSSAISDFLLNDSFGRAVLDQKNNYHDWYAYLLSTLALLIADEKVEYAYVDHEPTMPDVHVAVFTTNLVIVADVDVNTDGVPVARAVPRHSLRSMKLSTAARIDASDRRAYDWPGIISLTLEYRDLAKPIEIVANGINPYAVRQPSALVNLIGHLGADLADRRSEEAPQG